MQNAESYALLHHSSMWCMCHTQPEKSEVRWTFGKSLEGDRRFQALWWKSRVRVSDWCSARMQEVLLAFWSTSHHLTPKTFENHQTPNLINLSLIATSDRKRSQAIANQSWLREPRYATLRCVFQPAGFNGEAESTPWARKPGLGERSGRLTAADGSWRTADVSGWGWRDCLVLLWLLMIVVFRNFMKCFMTVTTARKPFWVVIFFKVLDSQRVACFPPTIPGLPDGREARVVTCNKL